MREKKAIDILHCKCASIEHHDPNNVDGKQCECKVPGIPGAIIRVPRLFARNEAEPNAKVLAEIIADSIGDYLDVDGSGEDIGCYITEPGQRAIERELQKGGIT